MKVKSFSNWQEIKSQNWNTAEIPVYRYFTAFSGLQMGSDFPFRDFFLFHGINFNCAILKKPSF